MNIKLAVVMDPIAQIKIHKDSTFAMLLAAQDRGWDITYLETNHLSQQNGITYANGKKLCVRDDAEHWYDFAEASTQALSQFNVVFMRKDPPFDMEYIYTTYLLQQAAEQGTLIVNHPTALRNANEKLAATWFPELCTPSLVTREANQLKAFIDEQQDVILKPLDGMGGASIFRVQHNDANRNVIIETLTAHGTRFTMAQRYIPEITEGDKRILVVNGEAVPYALARIPAPGETRGNLAAGGQGVGVKLTAHDQHIVATVAPRLLAEGILFAGLDVIGDYLTEINITSPTCIRELDKLYQLDIAGSLMDCIEQKLAV
jgi:glutathione synthase